MRREVHDPPLMSSKEQIKLGSPLPLSTHDNNKFNLLLRRCLAPIYAPVLLCSLLFFITVACLYFYSNQDSVIPFAQHSNTSRIAICLVGGARRFELTGPTILKHVLNVFPEADLFVHSNFDENCFKLGLFRLAPRVVEVRIRRPVVIPETDVQRHLLMAHSSLNGLQGLLQYFDLVEGCLDMISKHESHGKFTYDWIVRTRLDGYWNAPLERKAFKKGVYVVPEGCRWGGLNDRLGIGNRSFSEAALSRLSLLPRIASTGSFSSLTSEAAFGLQLAVSNVPAEELRLPFCILSDRCFGYPPEPFSGVLLASISSPGPLSGAYCRPCIPQCKGECVKKLNITWNAWSWTEWRNGSIELCDGRRPWQDGWEDIFDKIAGEEAANVRRTVKEMMVEKCVREMEVLKRKAEVWNAPDPNEICKMGLSHVETKN